MDIICFHISSYLGGDTCSSDYCLSRVPEIFEYSSWENFDKGKETHKKTHPNYNNLIPLYILHWSDEGTKKKVKQFEKQKQGKAIIYSGVAELDSPPLFGFPLDHKRFLWTRIKMIQNNIEPLMNSWRATPQSSPSLELINDRCLYWSRRLVTPLEHLVFGGVIDSDLARKLESTLKELENEQKNWHEKIEKNLKPIFDKKITGNEVAEVLHNLQYQFDQWRK